MTARRPGSLAERVRAIGADHGRALALVAAEGQRTAEQTEALMTDHRDTRRILQDVEARVLVVAGTQGEMLSVFREMAEEQAAQRKAVEALGRRLATTAVTATEARSKASGAHKRVDSQESLAKERDEAERIREALERQRIEEERRADAERDRQIAELQAERKRIADEEAKYEKAAEAGAAIAKKRGDDMAKTGALGAGGLAPIVTAFIAALNGQSLGYVLVLGLGIGAVIVGAFFLLRHFRKAKS
jgi:hypothetical protein